MLCLQYRFCLSGARRVLALWALEWAWHPAETKMRCEALKSLHAKYQLSSFYSFRDLSVHTDGQTDMARSTRLVTLIKNKYTLRGRKRFLLPVTYFPMNLVYPFTLRVTGIKMDS